MVTTLMMYGMLSIEAEYGEDYREVYHADTLAIVY